MTKVLFLLSAVVMAVAGVFSYQNREAFVKLRKEHIETMDKLTKEKQKVTILNSEVGGIREKVTAANNEVSNESERLSVAKVKLKTAEADSDRVAKEVETANGKIADYKKTVTNMPPGVTLETINEDINKLKQGIADAEGEAAKIQEQVVAKEGDVKKVQVRLDNVVEKINSRKKLFDRNSMTATVVAVNADWGFVVIDAGENKGITVDTKLLVTRGQESLGRLNIIGVDGNKTVANIDQKSIRPGFTVAPGDRVILENLYQ